MKLSQKLNQQDLTQYYCLHERSFSLMFLDIYAAVKSIFVSAIIISLQFFSSKLFMRFRRDTEVDECECGLKEMSLVYKHGLASTICHCGVGLVHLISY